MNNKTLTPIIKLALLSGIGGFLAGCNPANSEPKQTVIKPVKLYEVPNFESRGFDAFLAKIDAADRSQLSFQIPGVIEELKVLEGQHVEKGDLLAALDPTDYQLAFEASKAQYDLAKISYLRDKTLVEKKLISTDSFDEAETSFKTADATLEQAKTDLSYTKISAPFDGVISLSFIEDHEYVSAKQPILNILNTGQLDVTFSLPVPYLEKTDINKLSELSFSVTFDAHSGLLVPAKLKEISTKPDSETNSYTATVVIEHPENTNILSGMSGQVLISSQNSSGSLQLPEDAILTKPDGSKFVWRLNPDNQTVESVVIKINEFGAVTNGLHTGDLIVTAGAKELSEGQMVRAWEREGGI